MAADFGQMLKDGHWPKFDPTHTVLLRNPPPRPLSSLSLSVAITKAAVTLESYKNTEVEVQVDTSKPGYLVLNDVWHRWWFGTVDGKRAEVLQANVLFRAIQVPAGKHVVRFEFRPIEGAIAEVRARLKAEPLPNETTPPADGHSRPEANAQDEFQTAYIRGGILR
jgi:hypothetical protein